MPDNQKTILAISGSLRANSSNTAILKHLAKLVPHSITFKIYEDLGNLPHFSPELDGDDAPDVVQAFRQQVSTADGVVICTPEYAFGVPGVLKNALDWAVGSGSFNEKSVAVITASTGGEHAHASLLLTFKALNASISEDGKLLISFIRNKMNSAGEVTDAETAKALQSVLDALIA